ncbi:LapA family protein [Pseudaestuariivita atlantica]|uniref:Phosphoribosylanthranilate isomerase n=1 Tax=Pseudaestuariivita atlantica TaxID=1317121 RepID=A0A0L1JTX1_9RHOB|nr:LapA family protein [Pseudaestuariivita atlantica]KNG95206.1 phosphoribosylanthranilate isomerase [Pseudaestuariivita atlantica]
MRYIKYLFLAALAVILISVALANRGTVTLNTLPEGLREMPGMGVASYSIELPLYLVIFIGIAAGLLIGFVWEYLREIKHRSMASRKAREARELEREVKRLKAQKNEGKDEVLALLDETG